MKVLADVKPTAEQLKLFVPDPKIMVIKGAAGSGKTSTCLLRLRTVLTRLSSLRLRAGDKTPLKVLVFSYNRTLSGYINQLAENQKRFLGNAEVQISTFAKWAYDLLDIQHEQICEKQKSNILAGYFSKFSQSNEFLLSELEYLLGRFPHNQLSDYIENERTGRGKAPRFDKKMCKRFLEEVVMPYVTYKKTHNKLDFADLAYQISTLTAPPKYDVVIIDEGQDFSANELRAIVNVLNKDYNLTIVLDSAQKIYSKSFSWAQVGLKISAENVFTLKENFRNTKEIATFIAPILDGADLGGDFGALPSPEGCTRNGSKPILIEGKYSDQLNWVMKHLLPNVDLKNETVAFLHPKNWFSEVRKALRSAGIAYVNLTREPEWPDNTINVGLVTMHSAKGLEFDHVIILGLNQEVTPHGKETGDVFLDHYRRLLAMSCGRARETLTVGYKKNEMSSLISYLDPKNYVKKVV